MEEVKQEIRFSIIIPIFGVERYLHQCLNSILIQTYANWELLLIDDGSLDSSGQICDEYAAKDSRIRVFHKTNGGVSSARNVGLENAVGEYVAFVDADDWVSDDWLNICNSYVSEKNIDFLQYAYWMQGISGKFSLTESRSSEVLSGKNYISSGFFSASIISVIRRSIVKHLRFVPNMKYGEDLLFMLTAISCSNRCLHIEEACYYYRRTPGSAMRHHPDSVSLMTFSQNLIVLADRFPACKRIVDQHVSKNLLDIIFNNDISYNEITKLFHSAKIGSADNYYIRLANKNELIAYIIACVVENIWNPIRPYYVRAKAKIKIIKRQILFI